MKQPIFVIGGSKGGVGKSTVSVSLIDHLLNEGKEVLLIESDTSNPDVAKMYSEEVKTELINLDHADGWIDLVNICDENPDSIVIVNTAARNNSGVAAYGVNLNSTLNDLNRSLITLWVINRQRDSIELLRDYMEALPNSTIHVVRNSYFGEERKFELYNSSSTKKMVEDPANNNGKSITFPEVADRVSDDLFSRRLSISAAFKELPLGNRAELQRWQKKAKNMFGEIIHV